MDIKAFLSAKFEPRKKFIEIPELKKFFPEDAGRIGFEVRGLDGVEYQRIQAGERVETQKIAYDLLSAEGGKGLADAVREYLGVGASPGHLDRMLRIAEAGIVWPEMKPDDKLRLLAKMARYMHFDFLKIFMGVTELTGAGYAPEG